MSIRTVKRGKRRRFLQRNQRNLVKGFGKSWSEDSVIFRVEFSWVNRKTSDETNETINWIECRKFKGEERNHILNCLQGKKLGSNDKRETIESNFVCFYAAYYLCKPEIKPVLNQGFIYPVRRKHPDEGDYPLYQIRYSPSIEREFVGEKRYLTFFKKTIWHHETASSF